MKKILLASFMLVLALGVAAQSNIRLIRNATVKIEYGDHTILVDPMFAPKGAIGSIKGDEKSPMVDLAMPVKEITDGVNLILLTHNHPDHFDKYASDALDKSTKFFVQPADRELAIKEGFVNSEAITDSISWEGLSIGRTDAQHGTGRVLQEMGPGSGYILQAKDLPTIYIVGDAVWTQDIYRNIVTYAPDYIIVNSGGAAMPAFPATPIIMDADQTMSLVQESGDAKVIAVHMDAIDHCATTRSILKQKAKDFNITQEKLIIPNDGEVINL